jgi:hypothetical protein
MVEIILTEQQLNCLKDAAQKDSPERSALGEGEYFTSDVRAPELISVRCPLKTARALLEIARKSCPDLVPEIRAAIEQAKP